MPRLLNWPVGLGIRSRKPLSGPRSKGATSRQESTGGRYQSVSSAFGNWKYEIVLPVARGRLYRRLEGMVMALHGGANAVRVTWPIPDMSLAEAATSYTDGQAAYGLPWSDGLLWSNGMNWSAATPNVGVAAGAALDTTIISLKNEFWGRTLGMGDEVGFFPLHFGKYMITEELGDGLYRIWPPLRKAVTTADYATLQPILAMTLDSEGSADLSRAVDVGEETTLILSEVFDYDIRDYFTE